MYSYYLFPDNIQKKQAYLLEKLMVRLDYPEKIFKERGGEILDGENNQEYFSFYYVTLKEMKKSLKHEKLELYCEKHLTEFRQLIDSISKDNFWIVLPKILGLDAKMNLVSELSRFDDFSADEIIKITENDYKNYFKELCGYDRSVEKKNSIIFNVV